MKNPTQRGFLHRAAFTLIELLVVIAVITILAALILPVGEAVLRTRNKKVAYAQLHEISSAIEAYKQDHGFYPPDNPTNTWINPLYYELEGTVRTNYGGNTPSFVTLDGSSRIAAVDVPKVFGISGFVNSSTSREGTDQKPAPKSYLGQLKPDQIGVVSPEGANILVLSGGWNGPGGYIPSRVTGPKGDQDPWQYNSSHPTNNPHSFDLWVDVFIDGQTNRISNWSDTPQVIP